MARSRSCREDDWDFQLDINLKGTFLTCKYAIPEMRKRGGGAIVNTASVQAFASQKTVAAYAASKGGVVSFTTTVALDHARRQHPLQLHRPRFDPDADARARGRHLRRRRPGGRDRRVGPPASSGPVGRPEEVANLVLFLASDEASFCTGGCYRVDGGLLSPLFNG